MTVFDGDECMVVPSSWVPSKEKASESTPSHFTARRSVATAPGVREVTSMPPSYAAAKTEPQGDKAVVRGLWSRMMDWRRRGGDLSRSYTSTCISVDNTVKSLPSSLTHVDT